MNTPVHFAPRVSVFNHKGGVGKTTLTVNLAFALTEMDHRVLLVDSDPQCNLTSYLVPPEVVDKYLDGSENSDGRTIWSALRPVSEGSGDYRYVEPIEPTDNLFLLPGDIQLAQFESDLNSLWTECQGRKVRGFRGTTALSRLVAEAAAKVEADYVFYDSGPNIGPLNRAILLDCHGFVVPMACDSFSLRALKTVGRSLFDWISDWSLISELAGPDVPLLRGKPCVLGYVPGQFRTYYGLPAAASSGFLPRIEKEFRSQIVDLLNKLDPGLARGKPGEYRLGEVKHFGTLVTSAQSAGSALWSATAGPKYLKRQARDAFYGLAKSFIGRVEGYWETWQA